ncbi:hypothetical protein [Mitsuaria sp. 7]|uniref:hypothetical protein n=1 Tax=Mitsuaria sp. 7 TaxID=1658665 RepID=UPI0007DDA485|nr:hypothetical protein [Mitsuaria sp. 7]ANH67143.1 hypothetical protein ABE85_05360 [Mitsuaria sp. 7]
MIADRASRFGDRDPQQLEYLTARLRAVEEEAVAQGLLGVFTDGPAPPEGSAAQELAGQLLAVLRPRIDIDLGKVLPPLLGRYELSVEQLPQYLGWLVGTEQILAELDRLERAGLSPHERRASQTLRFWLRN